MDNPKIGTYYKYWTNDKGQYHREDGPAIEWIDGDKEWYINGKRHREDGPAIEYNSNISWWYNGKWIGGSESGFTQEYFDRYLRSLKIKEYW